MKSRVTRVGVISDTHGLMRPEALAALAGVSHIVHAGDVGSPEVLTALARIAPVTVVRGNNDTAAWARNIPLTDTLEVAGRTLYVLHDIAELDVDPAAAGVAVVIAGHSHKPGTAAKDGVMFLNPGSAGPRRFKLPVTVGLLHMSRTGIDAEIQELHLPEQVTRGTR